MTNFAVDGHEVCVGVQVGLVFFVAEASEDALLLSTGLRQQGKRFIRVAGKNHRIKVVFGGGGVDAGLRVAAFDADCTGLALNLLSPISARSLRT